MLQHVLRPPWLLALMVSGLMGCASAGSPPATQVLLPDGDCPLPPLPATKAAQLRVLGQYARDGRANLLAEAKGFPPEGKGVLGQRLVATLYPPALALLIGVLQARIPEDLAAPSWRAQHLLRSYLELRSRLPIETLEAGELERIVLRDERGGQYPALVVRRERDGDDLLYRIETAPIVPQGSALRLRLDLGLDADGRHSVHFTWVVTGHQQQRIQRLALLYRLMPVQLLAGARWLALTDRLGAARELLEGVSRCFPRDRAVRRLRVQLSATRSAGGVRLGGAGGSVPVGMCRAQPQTLAPAESSARGLACEPEGTSSLATARALRWALLWHWRPAAERGLIDGERLDALARTLAEAGGVGLGVAALHRFDRELFALLRGALGGMPVPVQQPGTPMPAWPAPALRFGCGRLAREAQWRLAGALRDFPPRLVAAPGTTAPEERRFGQRLVFERQQGREGLVATGATRVAGAWLQPALPRGPVQTRKLDRQSRYWQAAGRCAQGKREQQRLARRVVRAALAGDDAPSFRLALRGVLALEGIVGLKDVLARRRLLKAESWAALLDATAGREHAALTLLRREAALHPSALVRLSLCWAVARSYQRDRRGFLAKLSADGDAKVGDCALVALALDGHPAALDAWTERQAKANVEALWAELGAILHSARLGPAEPSAPTLRRLRRLARRALRRHPSASLVAAVAELFGDQAAPLLYPLRGHPALASALALAAWQLADLRLFKAVISAHPAAALPLSHALEQELLRALAPSPGIGPPGTTTGPGSSCAAKRAPPMHASAQRDRGSSERRGGAFRRAAVNLLEQHSNPLVRLRAQHLAACNGDARALLALGPYARASCGEAQAALPVLASSMDRVSRGRLFLHVLRRDCDMLSKLVWGLTVRMQRDDLALWRAGMSHRWGRLRTYAALTALGLKEAIW